MNTWCSWFKLHNSQATYHNPWPQPSTEVPEDVVKASIKYLPAWRNHKPKTVMTSRSNLLPPALPRPTTLIASLRGLPKEAYWAVKYIKTTDQGSAIAQVLQRGTAIAVSDGSLKSGLGTAAFVVEGDDPTHQIR